MIACMTAHGANLRDSTLTVIARPACRLVISRALTTAPYQRRLRSETRASRLPAVPPSLQPRRCVREGPAGTAACTEATSSWHRLGEHHGAVSEYSPDDAAAMHTSHRGQ